MDKNLVIGIVTERESPVILNNKIIGIVLQTDLSYSINVFSDTIKSFKIF